jgi:hypothetical protein
MVRRLALAAVGGLLIFAAPAYAGISASEALTILNQWKAQAGEPAVSEMDPAWSDGCDKHNNYMAQDNHGLTHYETDTNPAHGYTAEGADAGANSVLASPQGTPRIWEGSVYHRVAILQPRMTKSGWAASHGYTCMRTLDTLRMGLNGEPVKTYPWPPNGGTKVPTRFTDNESPDPHKIVPGELGYLISVNLGGPWAANYSTHVSVAHASLKTDARRSVTITTIDDDSPYMENGAPIGAYLNDAFALFPHGSLKNATTYTAHADGKASYGGTDYPFSVTWHFKTAGTPVPGTATLKFSKPTVKKGKVRFPLAASKSLVGRTGKVFVNRKLRNSIGLKLEQTIKVARPAKGETVRVKVTTAAFTREGVAYPAAKASRRYTRKL